MSDLLRMTDLNVEYPMGGGRLLQAVSNVTLTIREGETLGLTLFTLEPNFRMPFGHKHEAQEEVYVVVRGSGRVKVDDEIVELGQWDAIRFDSDTMRDVEAGSDGLGAGQQLLLLAVAVLAQLHPANQPLERAALD